MQNCDHQKCDLHDHPCRDRILRICASCMQELDAQYRWLADDLGLSLEQINRVLIQPRTPPEWIEKQRAGALALVGNSAGKSEGVEERRDRPRADRLTVTADDLKFLQDVGICTKGNRRIPSLFAPGLPPTVAPPVGVPLVPPYSPCCTVRCRWGRLRHIPSQNRQPFYSWGWELWDWQFWERHADDR